MWYSDVLDVLDFGTVPFAVLVQLCAPLTTNQHSVSHQKSHQPLVMHRDELRRLCSLLAGLTVMAGVGSLYAISAWNAQLKELLRYSQAGIATVSSLAMLGSYLSYLPGVAFDRLGPHRSIALAGAGLLLVYGLLAAAIAYTPARVSPLLLGLALIAVGQLSAFGIFASIVPNEGVFGDAHRGKVMAALTSAYSGGGAVFALVYHRAFDGDVPGYFAFLGVLLLALCAVGWLALVRSVGPTRRRRDSEVVDANVGISTLPIDHFTHGDDKAKDEDEDEDVTGLALLSDARFWLLFVTVLITVGACLFVMSNVAFIVESLGGPMEQVPLLVASFSMSNTLARLGTGVASDRAVQHGKHSRAAFAALSVLFTALALAAFLVVPATALLVPVTMAGVAEGVMFGTFPVIIREAFGLQHFGKNYGLISVANCIGYPFVLSPLSSYVYERAAAANSSNTESDSAKCFGAACFRPVFLVAIALCGVAFACCVKLMRVQTHHRRYRALS